MIKTLAFTLTLFMFQVYADSDHSHEDYTPHYAENRKELASFVQTGYLKVNPGKISFPNGFQRQVLSESMRVIEAVINSIEFKERVIGYIGADGRRMYSSNKGLSNEAIYEKLMIGAELLLPKTTGEMNFDISYYNRPFSKVIGYTSPGKSNKIFVNWKFYKKYDAAQMASNITHEWIHLCGFYHDSARDHDSVPYAVGYIVEDLAKKYVENGSLD